MAKKKGRQTFEKLKREQAVRDRRARKEERKEAARIAKALGLPPGDDVGGEPQVESGDHDERGGGR
jgi:hypothetical protein